MEAKERGKPLNQRIRSGEIRKADVIRRLAELAFGKANDCVRLVLEEERNISKLDLSQLCEVRRNDKGTVEVKLVDRLRALQQLTEVIGEEETDMVSFLQALQGGEEG